MSNVNFYKNSENNNLKSFLLLGIMIAIVIATGYVLSSYFNNSFILYIAIFMAIAMNVISYWYSDKIVLKMANAKEVTRNEYKEVWNSLENLCISSGMQMPKFYIMDDASPNAFATGRDESHAVVAVTTGLIALLNKNELEAVLAHELTHIKNKDILLQTIVTVFASFVAIIADMMMHLSFFGGDENKENKNPLFIAFVVVAIILMPIAATIVKLAISRKREFMADAGAVIMTRYPEAMASALQKISDFPAQMQNIHPSMNHMYIFDPVKSLNHADGEEGVSINKKDKISFFAKMFMTHPPIEERIEAVMGIKM